MIVKKENQELEISFKLKIYEHISDLPLPFADLVRLSIEGIKISYAPYSNFLVGAAVLTKSGKMFVGANQENAAYPQCMCGERVALYHAAMASPLDAIEAVAISVKNKDKDIFDPVMPCGACRQVISEYENRYNNDIMILLRTSDDKVYVVNSVKDILPLGFNQTFL